MGINLFLQVRLFGGVIAVVFGVVGIVLPGVTGVVEAVPQFDLEDDIALGAQREEVFEAVPVNLTGLRQVVETRPGVALEGPDIAFVAAGHGAADIISPNCVQEVEMSFYFGNLKEIVFDAAA